MHSHVFSPTVSEYNPYDHLTMRALINLEWVMNIPVLTKLSSNLDILDKTLTVKLNDSCDVSEKGYLYLRNNIVGTIEYLEDWVDGRTYRSRSTIMIPPTWRNFIMILKDISPELNRVAYQIKHLFKGKL